MTCSEQRWQLGRDHRIQKQQGHPHLKYDPSPRRLQQQRFWCPPWKQTAAFCIVWLVQRPIVLAPDMCFCAKIPQSQRNVAAPKYQVISISQLEVGKFRLAHPSSVNNQSATCEMVCLSKSTFHMQRLPCVLGCFCCVSARFFHLAEWSSRCFSQLTPAQFDPDVSLTCLKSGVAHILSVAVADRFGILVGDQGQMLDTERRTCTTSSKTWMEHFTCSLPCCHREARNQWLVAWDRSGMTEKELSNIDIPQLKQVFQKWDKEDPLFFRSFVGDRTNGDHRSLKQLVPLLKYTNEWVWYKGKAP